MNRLMVAIYRLVALLGAPVVLPSRARGFSTPALTILVATTNTLDDAQIAEYMSATELHTLSFPLFAYAKLGEAAYPTLVDTMSNLTGGTFSGGSAADYKNMPI